MHPRRWGWFQSLLDTTNRPLFPPVSQFPQNASYNPTGLVGALAYHTAEAITTKYLKNPGPLVHA